MRLQMIWLLGLFLCSCHSKPLVADSMRLPYTVLSWVKCREITGPSTNIEFYLWNKSDMDLDLLLADILVQETNSSIRSWPIRGFSINYKAADGTQSFEKWQVPAVPDPKARVRLKKNDAVDIEFDVNEGLSVELKNKIALKFRDPKGQEFRNSLVCQ